MRKSGSGIDRINRLSLVVIGLVLVAAGAAGMALGTGLMGSDLAGDSISDTLGQVPTEAELWVGLGAVAAGLLLAYISPLAARPVPDSEKCSLPQGRNRRTRPNRG